MAVRCLKYQPALDVQMEAESGLLFLGSPVSTPTTLSYHHTPASQPVLCPSDKRAHAFGYFILNYKFYLRVLKPTSGFPPLQPPAHRGGRQINSLETVGSAPSLPRLC